MRNVDLSLNADGCLTVRSRAVAETYWPEPAESLGAGRFQTSDLAELNDGIVHLRGRLSDQINVAGRKVSPAAIEEALLKNPAVRECGKHCMSCGRGREPVAVDEEASCPPQQPGARVEPDNARREPALER